MKYDYLIAGAGFSGCVLAERLASVGKSVLLIDKRDHIGGNCRDYIDQNGVTVHQYGPHAFHTNLNKVNDYVSRFIEKIPYEHRVLAKIGDKKVPIPFNFKSIDMLFDAPKANNLKNKMIASYGENVKIPVMNLLKTEDSDLKFLAEFVMEYVFRGYTVKQWGIKPEELDPTVMARVPVMSGYDDRYFQDTYQYMPKDGYSAMTAKMISGKNIELQLSTDFKSIENNSDFDRIIFTGPIDEFFDGAFGALPYRSLEFEFCSADKEFFQERAQVNFPNDFDYTRITEFKHFNGVRTARTTIAYERAISHKPGRNDPYYPINSPDNDALYEKYAVAASKLSNVIFTGRLAEYKYYNMDQTIACALSVFDKILKTGV